MSVLVEELSDYIIEVAKKLGHDELGAKIYSTLYISDREMTLDELADITGYSLASISLKINYFEKLGLVNKTRKPGSKRIYCFMDKDRMGQIKRKILAIHDIEVEYAKKILPNIIRRYEDKELNEKEKKMINLAHEYMSEIEKIDEMFVKIKKVIE